MVEASRAELKWTQDLSRSFAFIEKAVTSQHVQAIAFVILSVFAEVFEAFAVYFPAGLAHIAAWVMLLFLANRVIREVHKDAVGAEGEASAVHDQGPPIMSMLFLSGIYVVISVVLFLLLIVPGLWWIAFSCVSMVIVCIEDHGAVAAVRRSVQLVT